ncbi:MAG: MATE family efflux transporter [Tenericutes bacterium]|nr:MATE family efflux transporter [Mycoplasmatota bacterium]
MKSLIGSKSFYKKLIAVSLPIIVQQLITSSLQLVDNIMVGSLGDSAVGSVSAVNQLYFVVILVIFGALGGAGVYSAQYFGAKDFDKLKQTFRFKVIVGLLIAVVSFIVLSFFGRFFISLFTDTGETINNGADYLKIIKWSVFPWAISVSISFTFREIGITKPLLKISIVAILINTLLNFLLIFGYLGFPELGIRGAGIATLISRFIEFGLFVVLLIKKGHVFSSKIKDLFKIDKFVLKAIIIMAIPLMLNEILWSTGQTVFFEAYSTRGDQALAAASVTGAISQLVFVTFGGVSTGIAVMVGNTLGENKLKLARDNSKKLIFASMVFSAFMGVLLFVLSYFILGIYDISESAKDIARFNIRVNAFIIPVLAFNVSMYFTLRAGGDTRSTFIMDSGYMWVIQVPAALLLSRLTDVPANILFLIIQLLELPKMIFAYSRYKRGNWIRNLHASNEHNAESLTS